MIRRGCSLIAFWLCVLTVSFLSHAKTSLSGTWEVSINVDPAAFPPTIHSTVDLTYEIGDWSLMSSAGWASTGLTKLDFKSTGSLGDFSLSSSLSFDPGAVRFKRWKVSADWDAKGLSLSSSFQITPNYVALDISADGESGDLSLGIDVELRTRGGCELLLQGIDLSIDLPFCCASVSSEVSFSKDGFRELGFSVSDIEIEHLPWMSIDADLTFKTDAKELDLSSSFDFGMLPCIDFYIEVQTASTLQISSISIYGIGIRCNIGDISFEALSYLDGTHKLKGKYWEMVALSFDDEADCCGPFSGSVAVYFLQGGAMLFDVAYFEGSFSVVINQSLTFDMALAWDIEAGSLGKLTLRMEVTW